MTKSRSIYCTFYLSIYDEFNAIVFRFYLVRSARDRACPRARSRKHRKYFTGRRTNAPRRGIRNRKCKLEIPLRDASPPMAYPPARRLNNRARLSRNPRLERTLPAVRRRYAFPHLRLLYARNSLSSKMSTRVPECRAIAFRVVHERFR